MKTITIQTTVYGEPSTLELMEFDELDKLKWKELFDSWKKLKLGMRDYKSREPNFPEGLSESAYCIWSGSKRFIKASAGTNASFVTFNTQTKEAEQIKACSIDSDLTSFGPTSKWDKLIFMDFYADGLVDGSFNAYQIPDELIYNHQINRTQTFKDQQLQGRRPRLSLKDVIAENDIEPIGKNVKIWL
ncbi:MAG TPA: Bsp6I family type II restriction endonuclease [Candidatus Saccharibacteria bacterium]|nr:Bsp6I family type II restriction endonuclease [Candidatus Saccharibacteria bacterium]